MKIHYYKTEENGMNHVACLSPNTEANRIAFTSIKWKHVTCKKCLKTKHRK